MDKRRLARTRRHIRLRKKIYGTAERPRMSTYRSLNHIYVQIIDDTKGITLFSASTLDKEFKGNKMHKGNITSASKVGQSMASKAVKAGIKTIVFDRGGYKYHGRIKAIAEAARKGGLEF